MPIVALIIVLLMAVALIGYESPPACADSLQTKVNAAVPGATVEIAGPCVYREQLVIGKPLTLLGQPGAEMRGSDIWSRWQGSGSHWLSERSLRDFPAHGRCEEGTLRCMWPEQVFVDGEPLLQVASDPESGQFSVDGDRRVVLAENPAGHTVEVTVRRHWVAGESGGVTIEGIAMKHAANDSQNAGAITNGGYSNWTVRNNVLSDAHGAVVSLTDGTALELIDNEISRGGQLGVHGAGGADILIQGNEVHHNNTEGFDAGWEAGGIKTSGLKKLVAEGNEVHTNDGSGMWCDIDCRNVVYAENRIHHNNKMGILFEISTGVEISGNSLWENGRGKSGWGWGGGIVCSSCKEAEIYDNVLAWNADGISVISADRGSEAGGSYGDVTGVYVHDNTLIQGGESGLEQHEYSLAWLDDKSVLTIGDPESNNRGANNAYWYEFPESLATGVRYAWGREGLSSLASFNATPGEEDARYLGDEGKSEVLLSAGMPGRPEPG